MNWMKERRRIFQEYFHIFLIKELPLPGISYCKQADKNSKTKDDIWLETHGFLCCDILQLKFYPTVPLSIYPKL